MILPDWTQRVFNLIVAVHVLAYVSFVQAVLVVVGGRKVYLIDVVFAFFAVSVLVALAGTKPGDAWGRQHSIKVLALFAGWGLIELARGIPRFGLSAVGESRYLVLPALFYFFVLAAYRDRTALQKFVTIAVTLVCVMPLVRGFLFYFRGGRASLVDQFAGSEVLSAQAGFRFILAGEAVLVASVAVGLLMFVAGQDAAKRRGALLLLATSLFVVLAVVQVRAAWVTSAVGIAVGSALVARFFRYAALSVGVAAGVLALAGPVASMLGTDAGTRSGVHASLAYSATFLRDPSADVTAAWRLTLWRQALASASDHPLVGQGIGGYWKNVGPNGLPANQTPHNGYLAVLVKLGGIGLALLLAGVSLWCLELMRFIRREPDPHFRLLAKAVAVTVVMSATFAFFYDFTIAFWVALAAGTVLVRSQSPAVTV